MQFRVARLLVEIAVTHSGGPTVQGEYIQQPMIQARRWAQATASPLRQITAMPTTPYTSGVWLKIR